MPKNQKSSMPTRKQFHDEALKVVERWRRRLNLGEWKLLISLQDKDLPVSDDQGECLADISVDPVYLRASIRVFPAWRLRSKDVREAALIHELCHCLTQSARDLLNRCRKGETVHYLEVRDTIELLTQRIANMAQWGPR